MVVDCPRCHCPTMLVDSAVIYGRSYGPIYLCIICGAYVGCHPGSTRPLGTPADRATRTARHMAHQVFDPLWKSKRMTRRAAYAWLSRQMGLPPEKTHIGMFNQEQCCRVIQLCAGRTERLDL